MNRLRSECGVARPIGFMVELQNEKFSGRTCIKSDGRCKGTATGFLRAPSAKMEGCPGEPLCKAEFEPALK